jgi:N-acetyl-gamma-glutamyl-phosphate reductase
LVRLLVAHPGVELTRLAAGEQAGRALSDVFASLRGVPSANRELAASDWHDLGASCDAVFLALPHGHALDAVPVLLEHGCKVVDLGADFRLRDRAVYQRYYGLEHTARELLAEAVYGLPELSRERISEARLVANPGCYPTATTLALLPLLPHLGAAASEVIVVDAKSGVSGAGRKATLGVHYGEVNENLRPYGVLSHRHQPEIEQTVSAVLGRAQKVAFVPHLVPMTRGILSCCYVQVAADSPLAQMTQEDLDSLYRERYAREPGIRALEMPHLPETKATYGSNFCDVAVRVDHERHVIVAMAALDNLVKGAAGQAVQNFNLMFHFDESTGLPKAPLYP